METLVIDRLAAKGIRYTNAFTTVGVFFTQPHSHYYCYTPAFERARIWRREEGAFTLSYTVQLTTTTHGACIVIITETVEDSQSGFYSGPIRISERPAPGQNTLVMAMLRVRRLPVGLMPIDKA